MSESVLILGINDRSALALARYLGRKEILVHVTCYRDERITLSSKYVKKFHKVSSPSISVSKCLNDVYQIIELVNPCKIIPINDVWCTLSSMLKKPYVNLVQLDLENYFFLSNKWKSLEYLKNLGIGVPLSHYIESEVDLESLHLNLSKYIIKPIYSVILRNDRIIQTRVRSANSKQQVDSIVREYINLCPVIIQEHVSGKGFGINILARSGQIEMFGVTERLIEPKTGGASSYRTNRYGFKDFEMISQKLVKSLQISGIFMIELKVGESAYFIEVNFRPWGSINTQLNSGNNFFSFYHQDFLNKQNKVFQANLRMELERVLRFDRLNVKRTLRRVVRIIRGIEKYDEIAFDDIRPAVTVFLVVLKKTIAKISLRFFNVEWNNLKILEKCEENMIFVCNGNINRSVFAATYWKHCFGFDIASAGIIAMEGRTVGKEYKTFGKYIVDGHLSNHVDKHLENLACKFVIFDRRQANYLLRKGVKRECILRLSYNEIKDPYGLSKEEGDMIFESIIKVIDDLRF